MFSLPLYPSLPPDAIEPRDDRARGDVGRGYRSSRPPLTPRRDCASSIFVAQFVLFEVGLRTWGSSEAAPAFQGLFADDPSMGYRLKPGARVRFATAEFDTAIAMNSSGVRDDDEIGAKTPDERRIVILGDSLVLAVQVPFQQTFGELLERRLNATQSRYRYRVINAGVQGYGPVEELLLLRVDRAGACSRTSSSRRFSSATTPRKR